jgi:RimJ/RimL family protein N-acetyltransferase
MGLHRYVTGLRLCWLKEQGARRAIVSVMVLNDYAIRALTKCGFRPVRIIDRRYLFGLGWNRMREVRKDAY